MIQRDYLIIGAGIGGASVCEAIRKYDKKASVTLIGGETYFPYQRWMLSKQFLREKTAPLKKLPHIDERWYQTHKIEARLGVQIELVQKQLSKRMPPLAMRSRLGVRLMRLP